MSQTPLTSEEYVAKGGNNCPYCGSTAIEGREIEIDSGFAYQPVDCSECNERWIDQYTLSGWQEQM